MDELSKGMTQTGNTAITDKIQENDDGRVCSKHFVSSDYIMSLRHILLNESPRKFQKLKPDALPTLMMDAVIENKNTLNMPELSPTPANNIALSSKNDRNIGENITIPLAEYKVLKQSYQEYDVLKKNMAKIFTPGQIRCLTNTNKRRVNWSAEDIAAAISLRSISPKGYRYLRTTVGLPLPAFSTLRKWASKFEIKEGLLENVITLMKFKTKSFNDLQKLVTLSFDEIYLSNKIEIDKKYEQKIGPHNTCQCVMARGLCAKWKQPIYFKCDQKMTKDILFYIIKNMHEAGLTVVALTCDMGPGNQGLMKSLNIGVEDGKQTYFHHPSDSRLKVHVFFDVPHLLKLARNHFIDHGFIYNNKVLTKQTIEKILAISQNDFKLAHKITQHHLNLQGSQRQKVRPAAQLFSNTVAQAIKWCGIKGFLPDENWLELTYIFKVFNDWFDVMNSRMKFEGHKNAYGINLDAQNLVLAEMDHLMGNIKTGKKTSTAPFQKGILISNKSLTNLLLDLKERNNINLEYIMSSRLNQDVLENFFSYIRSMGATHDHPTALSFKHRLKWYILGKQSADVFKCSSNTRDDPSACLIAPLEQPGTSTCDAPEEPEPITEDEDVILTGILNSYVELEHQGNDNESSSLITSLQSDELEVGKSFSQCDIAFYFPTNEEQELLNAFELQMACTEVKEQGLIYIAGYVASRYLSTSTPLVYVNETCLECERVRAACERLGTVAIAPSAEALSPPQQLPTSPPYLITTPFEGELFDTAHRAKYRVLGPTAVLQLAERDEPPPANSRPLYSLAMRGAVICFSGFRKKEELTYLINLIHYMGGSIRKDMSSKVTHLIAAAATGDKYRYASGFGLPVLARSWVDACWERRDDPTCFATNDDIIKEHKLMVFAGARVCFVGFPEDETQHMADVLASNGGSTCQIDDPDCSHVVMANGETFGRSLILSSHPSTPNSAKPSRATPNRSQSTPKSSLYRRLSARLSGRRASPTKHSDVAEDEHEKRLQLARNSIRDKYTKALSRDETDHLYSISYAEKSFSDDLCFNYDNAKSPSHVERVEYRKYKMCDKENKDVSPLVHSSDRINNKDKREVFRNKSMNVFNLVDCLTEAGSVHSSLTKSLCDLESKDEPVFQLANSTAAKELQQSTTTISSGKKRSRKSTDSNFQVSTVDSNLSPDKCEDSNWKSIKRLKIKDSFKFKNRPTIFKRTKKESVPKPTGDIVVEPVSPDSVKPTDPAGEFVASTSSPIKEDDNASICSLNTSKQSGFFDISFASIRSSKTVKSASKLRRSVKSFTASFRSERKKKYEKRNTVDVDACHLPANLKHVSTPKTEFDGMNLDISPVQVDTVDSTELGTYSREPDVDELDDSNIFKTPQSVWLRAQRHSICDVSTLGGGLHSPRRPRPAPLAPAARDQPPPASTPPIRDAHTILQCHGISLPVVDEHNTIVAPECPPKVHIVKAEWFWASVQNEEAQDERDYLFKDYLDEVSRRSSVGGAGAVVTEEAGAGTTPAEASGTPSHLQRLRKRKLRGGDSALHKRRSSVGDAVLLSLSGNLLDCTPSPDGKQLLEESEVPDTVVRKLLSPRQQVFMELLQTESNYVGILHTIVTMFKQPLEEMAEEDNSNGKNQALLNNTELKIIFGNLPPIYELHQRMLEELRYAQAHWSEETSIGRLVLRYTPDMEKAYPPFVNFFENTKEMLQQCDRENPRFHAFLKICQTKPECGRQSLQELLIRPVQRLPSISLLLDDILKHTHKNNPDHAALDRALAGLRKVMSHINEDKRKTEGQLQMFDIYNDIDQCPPHLVSSHRSFVSRCEVVELSKELSGRGDHLVLFLFTDTMEVCKKRSKAFNSKSPTNGTGTMRIGSSKPYRHISLMPLSTVKRVVDIREAEDCHNVFALMCRNNQELKEKLYSFMITDETVDKTHFLRQLCRQMANTVCKADADKFLACLDSHQLDIDTSDLALSALSKVSKFAARTRIKVGRAFSFNKTPSKLKRAMSSMISPFGSTSNLTPASQLAQMRLASCNNINEMGTSGGGAEGGEVLVAPLSVQPTRKAAAGQALRRF